ncbi:MAG: IS607 family transposase [Xenococcaceae cyanobacterium]
MKLSDYAKQAGVTYKTAWRWWKSGALKGYQMPSGTIIIESSERPTAPKSRKACIYARVSSAENRDNLEKQAERLVNYATAKGYQIYKVVKEVGSGLNENRKQLLRVLEDDKYNILLVEHQYRLARFGINYMKVLLAQTGKQLEVVNEEDNGSDELMQDLVSIITSFCTRLYGLRRAKRKTEKLMGFLQGQNDEKATGNEGRQQATGNRQQGIGNFGSGNRE